MREGGKPVTMEVRNDLPLSRRNLLRKSIFGAAALGGLLAAGEEAVAAAKISKTEAKYQDHPSGKERCGNCSHLVFFGCDVVSGLVSSQGWCKLFKPLTG